MIIFWTLVAGLIGLALLFVLPPMLSKHQNEEHIDENQVNLAVFRQQLEELDGDLAAGNLEQSQYDAARRDLEKELLTDIDDSAGSHSSTAVGSGRWAAGVLALALPAFSLAMYLQLGDHGAVERPSAPPPPAAQHKASGGEELPPMEVLVQRLAERMEQNPDNLEGWIMLGRSYTSIGEHDKAIKAYERASSLAPNEPNVLLGLAEALARTGQGQLKGKPEQLIDSALELEPNNANGLFMKGMALFQHGDVTAAIERWQRVQAMLDPNSEDAAAIRGYIAEARQKAGMTAPEESAPVVAATAAPTTVEQPAAGKSIKVNVTLADAMAGKFSPDDTLFVFARAASGPPMPLAVQRLQAKDLPVSLTLDDSMAMMPQMRLSNFDQVVVGARISKSGNAMPQNGDLQGEIKPVTPGQEEVVAVIIDSVR